MKYLIRLCMGIVHIQVSGYAPERFLNLCKNNNIELYHICATQNGYEMDISAKDIFLIKKLLRKTGTRIKIKNKQGLPFWLFRYRRHKFFAVGIGMALFSLILMSQFLWEIQILGNYQITDEQIIRYLHSQNIHYGTWIGDVDCEILEEQIRNDYPDIVWVSARMEGTRLILDIQELKMDRATEETVDNVGTDLIASQDGKIASIVTRKGTPIVTAGMEVKQGDVLVSGCNELYDDYGTVTGYEYCQADADVSIIFDTAYQDSIELTYEKKELTGKTNHSLILRFPQKSITFKLPKKKYEHYQIFTQEHQLQIGKRIIFPIYIQQVQTEELTIKKEVYTEREIQAIAKNNFALYAKKMEKKGFQILDKNGKIKVSEKMVLITGQIKFQYLETKRDNTPTKTIEIEEGIDQNGIDSDTNGNSS